MGMQQPHTATELFTRRDFQKAFNECRPKTARASRSKVCAINVCKQRFGSKKQRLIQWCKGKSKARRTQTTSKKVKRAKHVCTICGDIICGSCSRFPVGVRSRKDRYNVMFCRKCSGETIIDHLRQVQRRDRLG